MDTQSLTACMSMIGRTKLSQDAVHQLMWRSRVSYIAENKFTKIDASSINPSVHELNTHTCEQNDKAHFIDLRKMLCEPGTTYRQI